MTQAAASRGPSRSLVSLLLSWAGRYASRPPAAVFVVTVAGGWIIVSVVAGFPARWETIFQTVVAALTLAMVFIIQHSQARHQRATQRKLDEILLAIPGTDNALLTLAISGVIIQGAGIGTAFLAAVGLGLGGQGAAPGKTLVAPGRMAAASHVRAKRV